MNKNSKLVIIGGGFAGARVAQDLANAGFTNVTLIDKKDYFEVTYATLRTLAEPELGQRSRMPYSQFIKGTFLQGSVVALKENHAVLDDGSLFEFDLAVIASGSSYPSFPIAKSQQALSIAGREEEISEANQTLKVAKNVLIVGGGIVGVELAGEIADHFPEKTVSLAHNGNRLVPELKAKASQTAEKQLKKLGVTVHNNKRVTESDSLYQQADLVYQCVGALPNTKMLESHYSQTLDSKGRIKVNTQFRVEGTEHLFALGDCANVPEGKLGYLADQQASALAKNIIALAANKSMKPYKANPMMSLVPVGRQQGFVQLPFMVTTLNLMVNMKQNDLFILKSYKNLSAS
ncbi:FAD-dependent oxidoreductase [Marinomonas sp. A79]|uniref:FAD-dependent oxidoreductase n=1 Tax=Marinomonas vulgaris TaxID=2823372 RepID=A0ABS5HD05_9GAMM|nr:FAD-dependent oxidoreductase [Marinomonas vulgaris]MBR7889536.1 FAD-dependent oxidoreductase [Marinomonas vulgaris]